MKTSIHPDYVQAHVRCTCGNEFTTRATRDEIHVEVCSNCHPFYTGRQKLVDTGGRVERFQRRMAKGRLRQAQAGNAKPAGAQSAAGALAGSGSPSATGARASSGSASAAAAGGSTAAASDGDGSQSQTQPAE